MFKNGSFLILEQGAYSSFAYAGPFRVLKDIDKAEVVAAFQKVHDSDSPVRDEHAFVAWLVREGFIEGIASETWFLGDYGFNPLDFVPDEREVEYEGQWPEAAAWSHPVKKTPEARIREDAEEVARRIRGRNR